MTRSDKPIEYSIGKPSLKGARQLSEEYLLELEEQKVAEAGSNLTPVETLAKEIERQENMKVILTDNFSIEAVAFWQTYLTSRRPRGRRIKPKEAEQVEEME
jgi:hypothetical protein